MSSLQDLERRIANIEERNERVEKDKAWETSIARKVVVFVLTYFVIGIYLHSTGFEDPWLNAIVPAVGFFLSTLTLGLLKNLWMKYASQKRVS
jgi:hypothetical protein